MSKTATLKVNYAAGTKPKGRPKSAKTLMREWEAQKKQFDSIKPVLQENINLRQQIMGYKKIIKWLQILVVAEWLFAVWLFVMLLVR